MYEITKIDNCLISLIMPVFNGSTYIEATLRSIQNQTFTKYELIVVDDGSTDDTIEILEKYSRQDSRIKIIKQNHVGAGEARNKGVEMSSGHYLFFVDSDDLFRKDMLSTLYTRAVLTNADLIVCGYRKFDNETRRTLWEFKPHPQYMLNLFLYTKDFTKNLFSIVPPSPWGKLIKKSLVLDNNIKFQNLSSCNDFAFSYSIISLCEKIACLPDILLYYRSNIATNISSKRGEKVVNIIKAINELTVRLKKYDRYDSLYDTYIERAKTSLEFEFRSSEAKYICEAIELARSTFDDETFNRLGLTNFLHLVKS